MKPLALVLILAALVFLNLSAPAQAGSDRLDRLIKMLQDPNLHMGARDMLVEEGTSAVMPLIALLKQADLPIHTLNDAIYALGKIGDTRATEPLMAIARDRRAGLRDRAISSLGDLRDSRAAGLLISVMEDKGDDEELRIRAAASLVECANADALVHLNAAVKSMDLEILAGAHRYYIEKKVPGAEDALIKALDRHGDIMMAKDYLRSGNDNLRKAAIEWGYAHNHVLSP